VTLKGRPAGRWRGYPVETVRVTADVIAGSHKLGGELVGGVLCLVADVK
jgi:hypothetical protein